MPLAEFVRRNPRFAERAFIVALIATFAVVSIQYTLKALEVRDGKQARSAILRWREQLLMLDDGENIYVKHNYPNPPIMALLLRPLADMPPLAGALTWFYLKVAMVLATFAMTFWLVEEHGRPFPPWAKGLAVVLSMRPILGDLTHGNVNLFIMFLVVSSLAAFRRKWDLTAGVLIALAAACKVTPALFIGYFLWKRAWRTLVGVALGLMLFFVAIPAATLGWQANAELLASWTQQMVTPFLVGGVVTSEHHNQSLPGLIHRLLTLSPSFSTYVNDLYTPTKYHNLAALDASTAGWLVKWCMFLFAIAVALSCRTPILRRAKAALSAEYAVVVLGMLLFSERTWKHHAVTLLLPFAVLCYAMAIGGSRPRRRAWLVGTVVGAQVLMTSTSTGLLPDDWAKLGQVYGAFTWAFLLLVAALFVGLHRGVFDAAGPTGPAGAFADEPVSTSRAA
jgi:hypothetical protein